MRQIGKTGKGRVREAYGAFVVLADGGFDNDTAWFVNMADGVGAVGCLGHNQASNAITIPATPMITNNRLFLAGTLPPPPLTKTPLIS
jgi:hypothetical protein